LPSVVPAASVGTSVSSAGPEFPIGDNPIVSVGGAASFTGPLLLGEHAEMTTATARVSSCKLRSWVSAAYRHLQQRWRAYW
jgi:hypothetical protein